MKLSRQEYINKLNSELNRIGIKLSSNKLDKLYQYKELLLRWNENINLTAIVDDEEIIEKHIVDSAYVLKYIESGSKVIDVGTGAGLPGIVLAICNDSLNIVLLDALQKRVTFLQAVIDALNITNVTAVHARAEEFAKNEIRESFDVVVSRAVASLNVLMELTAPFAKIGGKCIYMKSDKLNDEMKNSRYAEQELKLQLNNVAKYELVLDDEKFRHNLAIYTKVDNLKDKYPRQFVKIKKNPL